jgi:mono/diheme cytochrome c family protein
VTDNCLACHGGEVLEQQRLTDQQWGATLDKMIHWGAPLAAEDVPKLRAHLAARRGPDAPVYAPPRLASTEASALVEPTEDGAFGHGQRARGAALYRERCVLCHGTDGRGGALGVNLSDRYLLYRAQDFARVVRAGRGRMPAIPATDVELADLLAHLRTL